MKKIAYIIVLFVFSFFLIIPAGVSQANEIDGLFKSLGSRDAQNTMRTVERGARIVDRTVKTWIKHRQQTEREKDGSVDRSETVKDGDVGCHIDRTRNRVDVDYRDARTDQKRAEARSEYANARIHHYYADVSAAQAKTKILQEELKQAELQRQIAEAKAEAEARRKAAQNKEGRTE